MIAITQESKKEIVGTFKVEGKDYYLICTKGGVCTLDEAEYKKYWGLNHPEHWKRGAVA